MAPRKKQEIKPPEPSTTPRVISPNTAMTEHVPSPYLCRIHHTPVHYYGDGTIWCDKCGRSKQLDEVVDTRRGRPVAAAPAAEWKELK